MAEDPNPGAGAPHGGGQGQARPHLDPDPGHDDVAPPPVDPRGGFHFDPDPPAGPPGRSGAPPVHAPATPWVERAIAEVRHGADDPEHVWRTAVGGGYQQLTAFAAVFLLLSLGPLIVAALLVSARLDQWNLAVDRRDGGPAAVVPVDLAAADDRVVSLWQGWVVAALLVLAILVTWCHRAYHNLAVHQRRFPEHWAISSWFLPGVNLWRPARVMRDIWDGSTALTSLVVTAWWAAFVVAPVGSLSASWYASRTDDLGGIAQARAVSLGAEIAMLVAALLGMVLVTAATVGQRRIARRYAHSAGVEAPPEPYEAD